MTGETNIAVRRATPAGEELRRQLLALVLAAVLAWYTFVVPAHAPARRRAPRTPEGGGRDGEVRGRAGRPPEFEKTSRASDAGRGEEESADLPVEELDWPEYICVE
jgi:hypothetical protein